MTAPTDAQVKAGIRILKIIADAIRELGQVPSGHLYARISDIMTLANYNGAIDLLEKANLIKVKDDMMIVWIGPA